MEETLEDRVDAIENQNKLSLFVQKFNQTPRSILQVNILTQGT